MSDSLFELPFWVKLADPGMSFHDPVSKLDLVGRQAKEVKAITPMTDTWLRGGGLVRTEAPADAATAPAPDVQPPAPAAPAAEVPPVSEKAPEDTTTNVETSTQETTEPPADETKAPEAPAAPSSLEDLLKGAGGDDEEDEPATSKGKTAKTGKGK